jgi:hypothetical protein
MAGRLKACSADVTYQERVVKNIASYTEAGS